MHLRSGYTLGNQLPYPMLWPPMTSINFDYTMIAPFTLFSDEEELGADPARYQFWSLRLQCADGKSGGISGVMAGNAAHRPDESAPVG